MFCTYYTYFYTYNIRTINEYVNRFPLLSMLSTSSSLATTSGSTVCADACEWWLCHVKKKQQQRILTKSGSENLEEKSWQKWQQLKPYWMFLAKTTGYFLTCSHFLAIWWRPNFGHFQVHSQFSILRKKKVHLIHSMVCLPRVHSSSKWWNSMA